MHGTYRRKPITVLVKWDWIWALSVPEALSLPNSDRLYGSNRTFADLHGVGHSGFERWDLWQAKAWRYESPVVLTVLPGIN